MPRGSKPGERRGGRQRGTPNKKTLIKNAVFLAAAADPNRSPLDFMLALMRDPQAPLDLRIDMAAAAAPFVHAPSKAPSRVRTNPMDSRPLKSVPVCAVQKQEGPLATPEMTFERAPYGEPDLSPLRFLIGVMNEPEATPKQRIRAARIAARYTHARLQPDKLAAVDEYGFSISRTLAKDIADDWLLLEFLEFGYADRNPARDIPEASRIYARQAERDQFLRCRPGYSPENDLKRRSELHPKLRRGTASMAESTEFAYAVARITASETAFNRTPEGRARLRVKELRARIRMRAGEKAKSERGLTLEEDKELERLHKEFPSLGLYLPYVPIEERFKQWAEGRPKSPHARIYELEVQRFDQKLTPAEENELEKLRQQHPERAERTRNLVVGRMSDKRRSEDFARRQGYDPSRWEE